MDNRYTPLEKQSKKAQKAYNSKQRVLNGFNLVLKRIPPLQSRMR